MKQSSMELLKVYTGRSQEYSRNALGMWWCIWCSININSYYVAAHADTAILTIMQLFPNLIGY